jgi:TolC family type I secretion outer membrane protein
MINSDSGKKGSHPKSTWVRCPILFAVLAFFLLVPVKLPAQQTTPVSQTDSIPEIKTGETLTLDKAIAVALSRHPSVLAARSTVDINRSRIGQAKSNYLPQVNFSADYTHGRTARQPESGIVSSGNYDSYTGTFTGSQNIYDFGRTASQVEFQKFSTDSATADLVNTREQIVLNLKQAYFGFLQAKRNRVVAEDSVKQFQQHLDQASGFYEIGTKSKFDVTKAEVDLSNAKLNLIRADNAVRIAKVTLDNTMGLSPAPEYTIEDTLSFQPYEITLGNALQKAFQNRPDLQSALARKKAAEQSIKSAKASYYPFLTASANYGWTGDNFPLNEGWAAGATLNFPIFNGYLTKYEVAEAKANLNVVNSNIEFIRQAITLDVQQAFLNLLESRQRIATAELTVRQATENLELANGRYAAGVGNPIEVTDALVNASNAQTNYNQALYDYKIAQASMDKATGVRY